jgi:hypothetical protein
LVQELLILLLLAELAVLFVGILIAVVAVNLAIAELGISVLNCVNKISLTNDLEITGNAFRRNDVSYFPAKFV